MFYLVAGMAFLGLTTLSRVKHLPFIAAPPLYVFAGLLLALSPFALALPNPVNDGFLVVDPLVVIEHATEAIVIISLTSAGLAIDTSLGWRS